MPASPLLLLLVLICNIMSIKSFFTSAAAKTVTKENTNLLAKRPLDGIVTTSSSFSSSSSSTNDANDTGSSTKKQKGTSNSAFFTPAAATAATATTSTSATTNHYLSLNDIEQGWKGHLMKEHEKAYFIKLSAYVEQDSKANTVYPSKSNIFNAFNLCPYDNIKVVIIGQDPYHGPNQAHGLAFSVMKGIAPPPSLKNIFIEANKDVNIVMPTHGNLESWSRQGVFLLNTCLTVRKGEANSHQKKGWEDFTDSVIKSLNKKEGIVYLLWGKPAQSKCQGINLVKNVVITSSHPSPLGAYKTNEPFMGSKCFSRCNDALVKFGKEPINWNL